METRVVLMIFSLALEFFLVVYLSLALDSPVMNFSLIQVDKKLYYINIAENAIKITKLQ